MADHGDTDWKSIRVLSPSSTTFTLYNLQPNKEYEFQVYSKNDLGEGVPSPVVRAKTKSEFLFAQLVAFNLIAIRINLRKT
jgi:hypothetical protein